MKEDVKLECDFEKENCCNLADFCLVCGIKLSCRETMTLYHPICAINQEYLGLFCSCWPGVVLVQLRDMGSRGITPASLLGG